MYTSELLSKVNAQPRSPNQVNTHPVIGWKQLPKDLAMYVSRACKQTLTWKDDPKKRRAMTTHHLSGLSLKTTF